MSTPADDGTATASATGKSDDGDMRSLWLVLVGGCMSLAQPKAPDRPWHSKTEECSPSYGYSGAATAFSAAALGVGWILWTTDAPKPDETLEFHFGRAAAIPLFGIAVIEGLDAVFAASTTGDCREYERYAESPLAPRHI